MKFNKYLTAVLFVVALLSHLAVAQNRSEFLLADRLMQQQKYDVALPLLEELYQEDPSQYIYFDKLTECYAQLKQYDKGLTIAQALAPESTFKALAKVVEGKFYYLKEDTSKALQIWNNNLQQNANQFQLYIATARAMSDRGQHLKAVEVYRNARVMFNNEQLFFNDIANELMQAGSYEGAVQEWLSLIKLRPEQLSNVQRILLRFNDPLVNDITILEIEDQMRDLPLSSDYYQTLFGFQLWLLQENKLYRRALVSARSYESKTSTLNYSLFNLGNNLLENKEFELARDAFDFYVERSNGEVRWRSMEELAGVYSSWAKHLDDFNLDFNNKRDSLFLKASELLTSIMEEGETYSRLQSALLAKAEINLDYSYDLDAVKRVKKMLENIVDINKSAEYAYLEGRVYMANAEYTAARIALTRSNKRAGVSDLAQKTRYFLALNDFFTGDYEFAKIQLKTLGRQNTSYYANDALELRLWLQEGSSIDTTGTKIKPFADAVFHSTIGDFETASKFYRQVLSDPSLAALHDDVYLKIAKQPNIDPKLLSEELTLYLGQNPYTSLKEQIMWLNAKLSEQAFYSSQDSPTFMDITEVKERYKELILQYPQGFYAEGARKRLNDLTRLHS